jgi:putative transposase
MTAERKVFIKKHGGTKNGFYVRNLDTALGKLKTLKSQGTGKESLELS